MSDWVRHGDELLNLATGASIYPSDEPPNSIEHSAARAIRTLGVFDDYWKMREGFDSLATHLDAANIEDAFDLLRRLREVDEIHRKLWSQ